MSECLGSVIVWMRGNVLVKDVVFTPFVRKSGEIRNCLFWQNAKGLIGSRLPMERALASNFHFYRVIIGESCLFRGWGSYANLNIICNCLHLLCYCDRFDSSSLQKRPPHLSHGIAEKKEQSIKAWKFCLGDDAPETGQ